MGWFLPAVGFSIFFAAYLLANQHYRLSAHMMVLWRGLGVVGVLTPFVFFVPWPHDPIFYVCVAIMGITSGFYERQTYDIAGRGNAGGLSRLLPLTIWVTFIIWLFVSAEIRNLYIRYPLHALAVFVSLMVCAAGLFWMQRGRVDAQLVRDVIPIVILRGITDVLNKTATQHSADVFPYSLVIYIWWLAVWVTITTLALNWMQTGKIMPDNPFRKIYIAPAMTMSFILIAIMACKATAMNFAANPACVTATALLSALWVALYHKIKKIPDPSHLWAGVLIVAGTFGLLLAGG